MHGFRDRPLTWLFIGATISVDLVMILPMLFPSAMLDDYFPKLIITIGVPMQLSLVAIWAATSDRYRLMRGAVLTAAVYAAILAAMLFALSRQEAAPYFLIPILVIWSVTLAMRLLGWLPGWNSRCSIERAAAPSLWEPTRSAVESQDEGETIGKLGPWRFPVVELFGWSCIVALWAYALHLAILKPHWTWWLARAVMVPLLMVVLLGGPGSWQLRCGCVGLVIGMMLLMQRTYGVGVLSVIYLIPTTYLALWYAVRRLDGSLEVSSMPENL
jgi:hypothetical protein